MLIDESLSPAIARALSEVGYNATNTQMAFSGRRGVTDPEIIEWLTELNGVWVHADDSARRAHAGIILASRVRTLWVARPKAGLSAAEELRMLAYKLPQYLELQRRRRAPRHFRLSLSGGGTDSGVKLTPYDPG